MKGHKVLYLQLEDEAPHYLFHQSRKKIFSKSVSTVRNSEYYLFTFSSSIGVICIKHTTQMIRKLKQIFVDQKNLALVVLIMFYYKLCYEVQQV